MYLNKILFLVLFLTSHLVAFGQADPTDPSSPNYRGANAVVDKFTGTLGATVGQGYDEFSEAFGIYTFSGNYILDTGSLTLNAEYTHPLDGDTDNLNNWQLEDLEIVYNAPSLKPVEFGARKINLRPRYALFAPTSNASSKAGLRVRAVASLIEYTSISRFTFILSQSLSLSRHQFETVDQSGTIKNTPVSLSLAASIRATLIKNLMLTGTAFVVNSWAYDADYIPLTGLSSNLYYQATPTVGLTAFVSWRDRVLTNNSVFDDDASRMGLGIVKSF